MRTASAASLAAAAALFATIVGAVSLRADVTLAVASVTRQELPDGPGKKELEKLCAGCHDLTFTISTRETEEGWTRIVNDMRSKGADGTEEDFAKVIAYLALHMGKPK